MKDDDQDKDVDGKKKEKEESKGEEKVQEDKTDDSNLYKFKKDKFVPLSENKDDKLQPPGLPKDVVSETIGKISLKDIIDAISVVITGSEMLLNDPHIDLIDVMNMTFKNPKLVSSVDVSVGIFIDNNRECCVTKMKQRIAKMNNGVFPTIESFLIGLHHIVEGFVKDNYCRYSINDVSFDRKSFEQHVLPYVDQHHNADYHKYTAALAGVIGLPCPSECAVVDRPKWGKFFTVLAHLFKIFRGMNAPPVLLKVDPNAPRCELIHLSHKPNHHGIPAQGNKCFEE